jgi:hypothetical protein
MNQVNVSKFCAIAIPKIPSLQEIVRHTNEPRGV